MHRNEMMHLLQGQCASNDGLATPEAATGSEQMLTS